eukprot:gene900-528_t
MPLWKDYVCTKIEVDDDDLPLTKHRIYDDDGTLKPAPTHTQLQLQRLAAKKSAAPAVKKTPPVAARKASRSRSPSASAAPSSSSVSSSSHTSKSPSPKSVPAAKEASRRTRRSHAVGATAVSPAPKRQPSSPSTSSSQSAWTVAVLKSYADKNKIDISGLRRRDEIVRAIKKKVGKDVTKKKKEAAKEEGNLDVNSPPPKIKHLWPFNLVRSHVEEGDSERGAQLPISAYNREIERKGMNPPPPLLPPPRRTIYFLLAPDTLPLNRDMSDVWDVAPQGQAAAEQRPTATSLRIFREGAPFAPPNIRGRTHSIPPTLYPSVGSNCTDQMGEGNTAHDDAASQEAEKAHTQLKKVVRIDTSETRYHVVRVAASDLGWECDDGDRDDVPDSFCGQPCRSAPLAALPGSAGQICWRDKSITRQTLEGLAYYQRVNHFLGMGCIARKAVLFRRLMKLRRRKLRPALLESTADDTLVQLAEAVEEYYPESFSTVADMAALQQHWELGVASGNARTFYILKPNTSCEGKGIRLTARPLEALTPEEKERQEESVVQVYVDRPLLLQGRKFDLRIYVLLLSVCPPPKWRPPLRRPCPGAAAPLEPPAAERSPLHGIQLLVHERGLVRVCAVPYELPSDSNCGKSGVHLTNYAVNKRLEDFTVAPRCGAEAAGQTTTRGKDEDFLHAGGNKRDLRCMEGVINGIPEDELDEAAMRELQTRHGGSSRWENVQRAMDECVALTILSGAEALRREYRGAVDRSRTALDGGATACFELLGFDLLLEARTLRPVLMEVNHSPSLFCETDFDFHLKRTILGDTLRVVGGRTPSLRDCHTKSRYEKAMKAMGPLSAAAGVKGTGWRVLLPGPSPQLGPAHIAKLERMLQLCRDLVLPTHPVPFSAFLKKIYMQG